MTLDDLLVKLRKEETQCFGHGDYQLAPINPDGPQAAKVIEGLRDEVKRLLYEVARLTSEDMEMLK